MKQLIALSLIGLAATIVSASASAQPSPPALPALTQQQSQDVQAHLDAYRRATDARVARGEITADEAGRLLMWREWQLAQQAAGRARATGAPGPAYSDSPPPDYDASRPPDYDASRPPDYDASRPPDYYAPRAPDYYVVEPAPVYGPYYRPAVPYYWGPRPYAYWGPSVCAGGFGRHFGGRICF